MQRTATYSQRHANPSKAPEDGHWCSLHDPNLIPLVVVSTTGRFCYFAPFARLFFSRTRGISVGKLDRELLLLRLLTLGFIWAEGPHEDLDELRVRLLIFLSIFKAWTDPDGKLLPITAEIQRQDTSG